MPRHQDTYRGMRYLVDTIDAGDGRHGYQSVVDGKRPLVGAPCATEALALQRGIDAAKAKIDDVLQSLRRA